jgi:hypothetical protein
MDPVNIKIMDVDAFIAQRNLLEVTSTFVKEPSTGNFDPYGLYSEQVFGEIGNAKRLVTHGYITLNTTLFNPEIYDVIKRMGSFYEELMRGTVYARFDNRLKDFVQADSSDAVADTGFNFFIANVGKLKFQESDSEQRKTRVRLLDVNRANWFLTKHLVIPAGLRDYREVDGRGESDEINTLYKRLLEMSRTLSGANTESPIFDMVRFNMQRCVNEIFDYIWNMISDDNGFFQKKYAARSVVRSTRNVLVATETSGASNNPEAKLKPDEVLVPLYQAISAFMPLVKYTLSTLFLNNIFSIDSNRISAINPKTLTLEYITLTTEERAKYLESNKLEAMIMTFRDDALRHHPVTVFDDKNQPYYLYLKYEHAGITYIARSFTDLRTLLMEHQIITDLTVDMVKPLTYFELYYHATYIACKDKHMTVTRYPISHHWNIFPARVKIATTINYHKADLRNPANPGIGGILPRWPDQDSESTNGISVHPAQLQINLNGDKLAA